MGTNNQKFGCTPKVWFCKSGHENVLDPKFAKMSKSVHLLPKLACTKTVRPREWWKRRPWRTTCNLRYDSRRNRRQYVSYVDAFGTPNGKTYISLQSYGGSRRRLASTTGRLHPNPLIARMMRERIRNSS